MVRHNYLLFQLNQMHISFLLFRNNAILCSVIIIQTNSQQNILEFNKNCTRDHFYLEILHNGGFVMSLEVTFPFTYEQTAVRGYHDRPQPQPYM